jgi:hypothetical protein
MINTAKLSPALIVLSARVNLFYLKPFVTINFFYSSEWISDPAVYDRRLSGLLSVPLLLWRAG